MSEEETRDDIIDIINNEEPVKEEPVKEEPIKEEVKETRIQKHRLGFRKANLLQ